MLSAKFLYARHSPLSLLGTWLIFFMLMGTESLVFGEAEEVKTVKSKWSECRVRLRGPQQGGTGIPSMKSVATLCLVFFCPNLILFSL